MTGGLWQRVCASDEVRDGESGVVFDLSGRPAAGGSRQTERGFVIRHAGVLRAYVNRCAHVPVELDWLPGQFFDETGTLLLCSVHGAAYDPSSGRCQGGPCAGRGNQQSLPVTQREGGVWFREE